MVCGLLFLWWQIHPSNRRPIISFRVYHSRNFLIGSLVVVIIGMMLFGQMYFVPQFLRGVQHHSASGTGELQTFNAICFTFGLFGGAILMSRLGLRLALAIGASIFALGMYLWAVRLTPDIPDAQMFLPLALTGFGAGWEIGPVSTLINSGIPDPLLGEAMELYLFQRQLGGAWGIAILTILVDRRRSFWSDRLGEHLNLYNPHLQEAMLQGSALMHAQGFAQSQDAATALIHGQLLIQSTVNAFADTFAYQMALGITAFGLILLLARGRPLANAVRWIVAIIR